MVKEMAFSSQSQWEPPCHALHKMSNHFLCKLLLPALLMGLSFKLFFSSSPSPSSPFLTIPQPQPNEEVDNQPFIDLDSDTDIQLRENSSDLDSAIPPEPYDFDKQDPKKGDDAEKCDIFSGKWIPNPSGPAYTSTSCPFIEEPQNCLKNGRPDTGYLYWKWKPHGCTLPPFDAKKFLWAMRNKTWALIGDSILRNHAQSLVCLLSKVERAVEVHHDDNYKSRKWHFRTHNLTLSVIWSPFLVKADIFEDDNGVSKSETQLYLDVLNNKWTSVYHTFDYVVISAGQWFLKTTIYWENNLVVGCHYCPAKNLTELGYDYAYGKVLQMVFSFVANSSHKPLVFYRTWAPDHFENGEWWSGGTCKKTGPYRNGEYDGKDLDHVMYKVELDEFERARNGSEDSRHLKLLNTFPLSLLRPDGHSGPYRQFHPFENNKNAKVQNDCLHWCLPGPIDYWNDLLLQLVTNH